MSPIERKSEKICLEKNELLKNVDSSELQSHQHHKRLLANMLMARRPVHELHEVAQVLEQKRQALPDASHKCLACLLLQVQRPS